jgi:hypothetical protein
MLKRTDLHPSRTRAVNRRLENGSWLIGIENTQQTERLEVLIIIEQHFRTIGNISEIS